MTELNDHELLVQYARTESEAAFATLVARYVNLVYSAALRFTGNPHHAEEITQAVFIVLARKAGSLRTGTVLSGWLYQTARLTAANFVKSEIRRQRREQEAYMQSTLTEPESAAWEQIAPLLDESMGRLGETDRNAIVLRFFENKTAQEVGVALKLNEAAAHKRVSRALEKLRKYFVKRGVTLTATVIAGAVAANSVQASPVGLAVTLTAAAAKGAAVSATMTTLVQGTLKIMSCAKLKLAVGIAAGILLVGGVATVLLSGNSMDKTTDPVAEGILNKVFEKYASLSSYSDRGKSFDGFSTNTFSIKLGRPDLYRMEWDAVGTGSGFSGAAWSSGDGHFRFFTGSTWRNNPQRYQRMKGLGYALEGSGNISGGAALTIPPVFFGKPVSDGFGLLGLCSNFLKRDDAKIDGVDCYVLTGHLKAWRDVPISLWIGKEDMLIHQIQRTTLDPDRAVAPLPNTPEFKKLLNEWSRALLEAKTRKPVVHTEIHDNIVVNQPLTKEDCIYQVPAGLQP